jgi:(2Fe-2S) ferredoxin
MPHRDRYLFVCTNRREEGHPKGSCAAKGSEELVKELKAALLRNKAQASVRACSTSCLDLCEIGAAIVQEPDHVAYGNVTVTDVEEIASAAAKGTVVERLVVHRGPLPKPTV